MVETQWMILKGPRRQSTLAESLRHGGGKTFFVLNRLRLGV